MLRRSSSKRCDTSVKRASKPAFHSSSDVFRFSPRSLKSLKKSSSKTFSFSDTLSYALVFNSFNSRSNPSIISFMPSYDELISLSKSFCALPRSFLNTSNSFNMRCSAFSISLRKLPSRLSMSQASVSSFLSRYSISFFVSVSWASVSPKKACSVFALFFTASS